MNKLVVLLFLCLALEGCTCADGSQRGFFGETSYASCDMKCCQPGKEESCRCSTACPCWRRHR